MTVLRAPLLLGLFLLLNAAQSSADPPATLPADGWWIRYFVTTKYLGSDDAITMKRTYSLVGTASENGQKCRWVEMKSVETVNGKERIDVLKFLVPEKALLENDKPLDNLIRAWRKIDDAEIEEQKFNQPLGAGGFVGSADFLWGRDVVIFPGPQRKSNAVRENRVVEYQQGRLDIAEGHAAKHLAERRAITVDQKQRISFEFIFWNHKSVALGFAAAKTRAEFHIDDVLRSAADSEWLAEDFGTGAKTSLPEAN